MTKNKTLDLLSFGEALVDFFPEEKGTLLRDVTSFTPRVGGAPANVAYGVAKLGGRPALMSVVGSDEFGEMILRQLGEVGVDTRAIAKTRTAKTGITFVQLDADGERSFLFYRDPSADMTVTPEQVDVPLVRKCRVVHAGTNLLMSDDSRGATELCLKEGHESGAIVSLDANLRPHLWDDPDVIRDTVLASLQHVHLFKANEEELAYLFPGASVNQAFHDVLEPKGVEALVVTHGGAGAQVVTKTVTERVIAPTTEVVDTTGAGDGFMAGLLLAAARFSEAGKIDRIGDLDKKGWKAALMLANLVGALVCTRYGAVTAVPDADEVPFEGIGIPQAP